jgi:DnaJ-class molecular chaperone
MSKHNQTSGIIISNSQNLFVEEANMVMPVMQFAPETCAWCEGKGKYGQYNDICLVCNGQGSVLVAQPSHKCPHCEGTGVQMSGEYQDRCKVCGGAGWSHVFKNTSALK